MFYVVQVVWASVVVAEGWIWVVLWRRFGISWWIDDII